MFKFRFPHKPNAKTKQARRVFFVRKRTLAIPAGLAAVCALCLITTLPSYVSAAFYAAAAAHLLRPAGRQSLFPDV